MRRSVGLGLTALMGTVLLAGHDALAIGETGTMKVHRDPASYTGNIGGGEFGIYEFSNTALLAPQGPGVKVAGFDFQTFCCENSNVPVPQDVTVNWTVNAQINGNAATPIAPQTAYLYTQFWNGTLAGYTYTLGAGRTTSANALQEAIWFFQGQWQGPLDAAGQTLVNAANSAVAGSWGNTVGNVRALTTTYGGSAAQDVLVVVQGTTPPQEPPPSDCCGIKCITFQWNGTTDCVYVYAVDASKCWSWLKTSIGCNRLRIGSTFTVCASSTCSGAKLPDSIKLVVKNRCGKTIECVTIDAACGHVHVGDVVGHFTVTAFENAVCTPPKPPTCSTKCGGGGDDDDDDDDDQGEDHDD